MAITTLIDLTKDVQDYKDSIQMSLHPCNLSHLKHSGASTINNARPQKEPHTVHPIPLDDSDTKQPQKPPTTTSTKFLTAKRYTDGPDFTPTKRAKHGIVQPLAVPVSKISKVFPSHRTASTQAVDIGGSQKADQQEQENASLGGNTENLIAIVNRAFPVNGGEATARRISRLEVLDQVIEVQDEDTSEDVAATKVDSSDSSSRRKLSEITTSDDYMTDGELRRWLRNVQLDDEITQEADLNTRTEVSSIRGCCTSEDGKKQHYTCAPGKTVQLNDSSFMRISKMMKNGRDEVFLAGLHLVRQNFLGLKMPRRRNEVVWLQESTILSSKTELHEVPLSQVMKNRELIFTNQRYPAVSSRTDSDSLWDVEQDVELGPLFCRWKMTVVRGRNNRTIEESIEHLGYQDAENHVRRTKIAENVHTRIADTRARFNWRQIATVPGGSHTIVKEIESLDGGTEVTEKRLYSFGDAFCGGGGASRGASDAELFVKWGFDVDEQAIATYMLNFEAAGAICRHEAVDEFLTKVRSCPPTVDVLHISPPCQPFSHAHTIPSPQRDEINQAALFSVWHLIETLKPRVVTIEETDALMGRHTEWFAALVNIFMNLGYSVRWTILKCEKYGVPQKRKRLFLIAAGPGEKLPPFPVPTHDEADPTLKHLMTIDDTISNIPHDAADHDPSLRTWDRPRQPFSGSTQAKTVTCKGGDSSGGTGSYHPTGMRPFTIRELASLQTFPLYHSFAGARGITAAKQQIGNAVPPQLARALFRGIIKSLKESDGVA